MVENIEILIPALFTTMTMVIEYNLYDLPYFVITALLYPCILSMEFHLSP